MELYKIYFFAEYIILNSGLIDDEEHNKDIIHRKVGRMVKDDLIFYNTKQYNNNFNIKVTPKPNMTP